MRNTLLLLSIALLLTLAGCPGPRAPVDLRTAEVKVMRFGLRHPRAAICPGEPVELDVAMEAVLDDGRSMHLVQRRRDLDDAIFDTDQLYLDSPQGRFEDGFFFPNPDGRVSLGTGFVMFARPPRGPAVSIRFPPYYECAGRIGGEGAPGLPGRDMAAPTPSSGTTGTSSAIRGGTTNESLDGGEGQRGPRFTVYVTWVKTADYTKLLAARAVGEVDMLSFAAPGYPLQVFATGGRGGDGGRGEHGESGGGGGGGGGGGSGGPGGEGGTVHVVLDERFDELSKYVTVDVRGGPGGRGGSGGPAGDPELVPIVTKRGTVRGYERIGPRGYPGAPGPPGPRGTIGRATIRTGDVRSQFALVGALVPL